MRLCRGVCAPELRSVIKGGHMMVCDEVGAHSAKPGGTAGWIYSPCPSKEYSGTGFFYAPRNPTTSERMEKP